MAQNLEKPKWENSWDLKKFLKRRKEKRAPYKQKGKIILTQNLEKPRWKINIWEKTQIIF